MKPLDPDKTELALGNHPTDVRTVHHSLTNDSELEFRLAKEYWLKTVQPYIAGRKLQGVEFYVAYDAYGWLCCMGSLAMGGNKKPQTTRFPEKTFPGCEKNEFLEPEELFANENLKPEILAKIAAPLVKAARNMTAAEAVHKAHELLMAAERYIGTLPKKSQQNVNSIVEMFEAEFSKVTFREILRSNEKISGHLPLLPPVQQKRNNGKLSMSALKRAVEDFLKEQIASKTLEQYESYEQHWKDVEKKKAEDKNYNVSRLLPGKPMTYQEWQKQNQDSLDDCLENDQISFRLLTVLRYYRFKKFRQKQQIRILSRNRRSISSRA